MLIKGRDFRNGDKVSLIKVNHEDGYEFIVLVKRGFVTYSEQEFDRDELDARREYDAQIEIMKTYITSIRFPESIRKLWEKGNPVKET